MAKMTKNDRLIKFLKKSDEVQGPAVPLDVLNFSILRQSGASRTAVTVFIDV